MAALDLRRDVVPFLIATLGEFFALVLWLLLQERGAGGAARAALWAGFVVERIAVATWVRTVYTPGMGLTAGPVWATGLFLVVITLAEVGIWGIWLRTARGAGPLAGPAVAAAALFVLIHALHSAELGVVRKQNPLAFAASPRVVFFSTMETAGAAGWLALAAAGHPVLGALVMLAGLTAEHLVQAGSLKPRPAPAPAVARAA